MTEVSINPTRMDLGIIDGTKPMEFWFEVTNNTPNVLDFTSWASCGCTTPLVLPSRVASGEKAKLKVKFDPTGKNGLQEKMVGVHYFVDGNQRTAGATFVARIN